MLDLDIDYGGPWYHGSDQFLTTLRVRSSITQERSIAKAFSHQPSLLLQFNRGRIRHNGEVPGYLYAIAGEIGPDDVRPHPHPANADRWDWLTERELKLELVGKTVVTAAERLTDEEIAEARRKQKERGQDTFLEWSGGPQRGARGSAAPQEPLTNPLPPGKLPLQNSTGRGRVRSPLP